MAIKPSEWRCGAHKVSRTWASDKILVRTWRRCSAHYSVRWCALENPLVRTSHSARAHVLQTLYG